MGAAWDEESSSAMVLWGTITPRVLPGPQGVQR